MDSNVYAIVLAGGQGTRLWPLSRRAKPKQVMPHPLSAATTLLAQTIDRLRPLFSDAKIFVVTSRSHQQEVKRNLPLRLQKQILVEEEPRGTAAAIALAIATIRREHPNALVVTINSDAFVRHPARYQHCIRRAIRIVRKHPETLTMIGIPARTADTGLGYIIRARKPLAGYPDLYPVNRFVEKPSAKQAKQLLKAGHCFWNPSIIVGVTSRFWESFTLHTPKIASSINTIVQSHNPQQRRRLYKKIPVQSIDVAVLEKERRLFVLDAADIGWSDIGQWATVHDILLRQSNKSTVSVGAHIDYDSKQIMAYNTTTNLIATVGLANAIIIATNDVILVVDKNHAHDVKHLVAGLDRRYAKFR